MSDDEFDYMSDTFVVEAAQNDVRPGLLHNHRLKRDHSLWKKKGEVQNDVKKPGDRGALEREVRSEGLQKPISSDNKGFAMLAKMGFNPDVGLGLHGQGRKDPVPIDVKTDKQGLGRKAALMEILEKKKKMLEERKKQAPSVEQFRANLSEKAQEKQTNLDLMKSQRVCLTMDENCGLGEPEEVWFWPEFTRKNSEDEDSSESDEEDEDDQLTPKDKLELLTMYLRRTHNYCVWCGVKYQDEEDMRDCPGPSRFDHDD